jgi:hypothetical protein
MIQKVSRAAAWAVVSGLGLFIADTIYMYSLTHGWSQLHWPETNRAPLTQENIANIDSSTCGYRRDLVGRLQRPTTVPPCEIRNWENWSDAANMNRGMSARLPSNHTKRARAATSHDNSTHDEMAGRQVEASKSNTYLTTELVESYGPQ